MECSPCWTGISLALFLIWRICVHYSVSSIFLMSHVTRRGSHHTPVIPSSVVCLCRWVLLWPRHGDLRFIFRCLQSTTWLLGSVTEVGLMWLFVKLYVSCTFTVLSRVLCRVSLKCRHLPFYTRTPLTPAGGYFICQLFILTLFESLEDATSAGSIIDEWETEDEMLAARSVAWFSSYSTGVAPPLCL